MTQPNPLEQALSDANTALAAIIRRYGPEPDASGFISVEVTNAELDAARDVTIGRTESGDVDVYTVEQAPA